MRDLPPNVETLNGVGIAGHLRDPRATVLRAVASHIGVGRLTIKTPSGDRIVAQADTAGPDAVLELHRWRAVRRLARGGSIGFAEAYMDGDWSSPDLAVFLELAALNLDRLAKRLHGMAPLRMLNRLSHLRRANTRRGSRRNIAAHYDLGNAFYRLWLDDGMSYSAALYTQPRDTLETAQAAKNDRIVDLLALQGGERVLEIGCGWGGLAERMARAGAAQVTAITLSQEQHAYATQRARTANRVEQVDIRLTDYRDIGGTYDRIASIEMVEAVGEVHWPTYFATLRDRLRAGGVAVLQAITIDDDRFPGYRSRADFIQRYIFPGGMLPSPAILREQIARAGLVLTSAETFGLSYARTLSEWQRRFQAAWPAIAAQGFGQRFKHMWEYYLAYCEAGFRAGAIDVGLYRIVKPD
jgi:cyclopropane-fatty-acyl-phospholipid synthase